MQHIKKKAKAMSDNEYSQQMRDERKKHKELRDKKKGRKWQWNE